MLLQSPKEHYAHTLKASVHFVHSIPLRKMATRPKSSTQSSRSPSPSAEEAIEFQEELLNSEHEEDLEVSFHPCHVLPAPSNPVGQPPIAPGMYMPYIEGPCMDWTVNDNLYHRFIKWCSQTQKYPRMQTCGTPGAPTM